MNHNHDIYIYILFPCIWFCLTIACNKKEITEFLTIEIDPNKDREVSLSQIAENIESVELELTDKSMIGNLGLHHRVIFTDDHIVFLDTHTPNILLFNRKGEYINTISKKGLGPGEYSGIRDIEADGQYIYIISENKIMSYNFDGNFIKEASLKGEPQYLSNIQNELYFIMTISDQDPNTREFITSTHLYRIDENFTIKDSILLLNADFRFSIGSFNAEPLSVKDNQLYIYYPLNFNDEVLRDTLYKIENHQIIPNLKIEFTDRKSVISRETRKFMHSINKSSRYVFTKYYHIYMDDFRQSIYDMKTKKQYQMKRGYKDDINTGEKINIRFIPSEPDKFYYLHTHLKDEQREEPNPTLYIGTLKK